MLPVISITEQMHCNMEYINSFANLALFNKSVDISGEVCISWSHLKMQLKISSPFILLAQVKSCGVKNILSTYNLPSTKSWNFPFEKITKVKNDYHSKSSNLSNRKEEAWKNQGFNRTRTRDLRDTGAMLYPLSYEATHWERGQYIEFISLLTGDMNSINWPRSMKCSWIIKSSSMLKINVLCCSRYYFTQ